MREINVAEIKKWENEDRAFFLLDVREEWEHKRFNIGGTNIPLSELMQQKEQIPKDFPVIIYCEKGIRSQIAIQRLQGIGFQNLYNLKNGIAARI
ncbi:MAG: rhodanese-like domain-containing protein [Bacteroidetes bacterium]|nr:rhodanese-like domain-containing protein [Bacteroidota bacterium]